MMRALIKLHKTLWNELYTCHPISRDFGTNKLQNGIKYLGYILTAHTKLIDSSVKLLKDLADKKIWKHKHDLDVTDQDAHNDAIKLTEKKHSYWKKVKFGLSISGVLLLVAGGCMIAAFSGPEFDETKGVVRDDYLDKPLWIQYIIRAFKELNYYRLLIKEPSTNMKLLPDPLGYPFSQPKYTLVIELSDVLIHPEWSYAAGWQYTIRPGLHFLLDNLYKHYEIVVYTSQTDITMLPLLEAIDPRHRIAFKLVKDDTPFSEDLEVHSLNCLNRDLSKVIIIDWNPRIVQLHSDNLFHVKRWEGKGDDATLIDLTLFLKALSENNIDDVREVLKHYSKFEDPILVFRENQKKYIDHLEAIAAHKTSTTEEKRKSFVEKVLDYF